jgi:splicing factor 3A subunit 1
MASNEWVFGWARVWRIKQKMSSEQQDPLIVIPPPEIRKILDKTAHFVARNGPSFEERIKENEKMNNKFSFLNGNDPYRAYYDKRVKEFKEGTGNLLFY